MRYNTNTTMEIIFARLANIWERLATGNLATTKKATETNVPEFNKILNTSLPVTEYETGASNLVRHLYNTNREAFFRYIHASGLKHLLLLTNGGPIVSGLGLTGVIVIRWDRAAKEFAVVPAETPRTERPPRAPRARKSKRTRGGDAPARETAVKPPPLSAEQYVVILDSINAPAQATVPTAPPARAEPVTKKSYAAVACDPAACDPAACDPTADAPADTRPYRIPSESWTD